jgi:hypothetical protein
MQLQQQQNHGLQALVDPVQLELRDEMRMISAAFCSMQALVTGQTTSCKETADAAGLATLLQ